MSLISSSSSSSPFAVLRTFWANSASQANSLTRIATGQRINSAADDPAGLITSEQLRSMIAQLQTEASTLQRADSLISTADAALGEVSSLLNDAEALAVANANTAGLSDAERLANQIEMDSIIQTVNRLSSSTSFNGQTLLDGTASVTAAGQTVAIDSVAASSLGEVEIDGSTYHLSDIASGGALNIETGDIAGAQQAISAARNQVSTLRGELGSMSANAISSRLSALSVSVENLSASDSLIRDTDYGSEIAELARLQILNGASLHAVSMTIANSQTVLTLLSM